MERTEFKPGDVVSLKSGGPDMTFGGASSLGDALCYWFVRNERVCETFPFATLKRPDAE
ncbi:YodC family protein [Salipiger aestuarii]|uniref:YodC family protein n=1 Tax=Salipiger aestuarii TaxID=568098 RepID=UPI00123C38F3